MTCNNRCSAALFFIALLLFAASNPLPVHGQVTIPGLPIPPITIPSPLGIPPIGIPPIGIVPTIIPPIVIGMPTLDLITLIFVTGQICCTASGNCPGQGAPGVPVNLTCVTNNIFGFVSTIVGRSVTDANGRFAVAISLPRVLVPEISQQFMSRVLPCIVTAQPRQVNAVSCPLLSTTNGVLLSLVQTNQTTVFPLPNPIQTATATGFILLRI